MKLILAEELVALEQMTVGQHLLEADGLRSRADTAPTEPQ